MNHSNPSNLKQTINEEDLIRGCLRGDGSCQQQLYDRFSGKMYGVCLRYARSSADAADILQEGFVKVFTKMGQYGFQGSFEGWIRKIMVNTALRQYQRQRFDMESSGLDNIPDSAIPPDALSMLSEKELLNMISKLPDGYRMIFNLVAIDGLSHAEAAEQLNIQESTSRSQLTKARRWLCTELEKVQNFRAVAHAEL